MARLTSISEARSPVRPLVLGVAAAVGIWPIYTPAVGCLAPMQRVFRPMDKHHLVPFGVIIPLWRHSGSE